MHANSRKNTTTAQMFKFLALSNHMYASEKKKKCNGLSCRRRDIIPLAIEKKNTERGRQKETPLAKMIFAEVLLNGYKK